MKVTSSTRRRFIQQTATAVTAFSIVPRHVLGGPRFVAPSEKVNIALVGAGGRGMANVRALFQEADAQVIAVADPAESFEYTGGRNRSLGGRKPARAEIEKHYSALTPNFRCADYEDFRVLLEQERALDAVVCATPDHLHAIISILAMRSGRHIYCEKPLTHNIREAREVARVARETGVATQMGNQGHATVGIRQTVEYLHAGAIGKVLEVHAWHTGGRWNPTLVGRPEPGMPVPAGLNWELWLGPREPRAFHAAYHPITWRDFWPFGCSRIGDFYCHDMDAATWALDLRDPIALEAHAVGPMDDDIAPHGCVVHYTFPARGGQPAPRVTWWDGGVRPKRPEALGDFPLPGRGVLFVGEKGAIQCGGAGGPPRLFPTSLREAFQSPPETIQRSAGHHREWLDACKGGNPAVSNFEYGARLTENGLLGLLAVRARKPIVWDAAAMQVKGQPALEPLIRGTYRKGWEIA
jgi:predicted dehydrogenase